MTFQKDEEEIEAFRDNFQFVPYRYFLSVTEEETRMRLAESVLTDIPNQVTAYMNLKNK